MYSYHLKMAEKALKKVEDQLNCSVCLDIFTDPKLLHAVLACLLPDLPQETGVSR